MSLSHCLSQMFTSVVHSCISYLNPKGLQCSSRWDVWLMNQYRAPYVESFPTWFSCLCFPSYVIKLSHLLLDGGSFARTWRGRPVTSVSRVIAQTLNLLINPGFRATSISATETDNHWERLGGHFKPLLPEAVFGMLPKTTSLCNSARTMHYIVAYRLLGYEVEYWVSSPATIVDRCSPAEIRRMCMWIVLWSSMRIQKIQATFRPLKETCCRNIGH